jgi:hypothetical protein
LWGELFIFKDFAKFGVQKFIEGSDDASDELDELLFDIVLLFSESQTVILEHHIDSNKRSEIHTVFEELGFLISKGRVFVL